jgi:hypothetical protein
MTVRVFTDHGVTKRKAHKHTTDLDAHTFLVWGNLHRTDFGPHSNTEQKLSPIDPEMLEYL